ncbi:S41 family peptidase [Vallitalea guaymasensis]|uniref:S41 family peptidase n=1 Tax=Vallitalea guaymasensis TaxID=1185412 RepID=UPI002352B4FC|nr:S41 family peptidase [Vallitalea guaymasensis]
MRKNNKEFIVLVVLAVIMIAVLFIKMPNDNAKGSTPKIDINSLSDNSTDDDIVELWKEDISYLAKNLKSKHKNLYHTISKSEFKKETNLLLEKIPDLNNIGRVIGLKSLVAKIGDGHTTVKENMNVRYFPLKFMMFENGIVVTNTTEEYKEILGTKLVQIGNEPVENIIEKMEDMISRDNEVQLLKGTLNYLINADFLYEYGYIKDIKGSKYVFHNSEGEKITLDLKSLSTQSNEKWVSIVSKYPKIADMSYIKNTNNPYWYEYLSQEKLLYFQYNVCMNNKERPINEFIDELSAFIEDKDVKKFVFDMRFNGGGDSRIIEPLIDELAKNKAINTKDNLYVVIGGDTFSSAILNTLSMKKETNATIIGSPTGGKPNHYGEIKTFRLPNTGITIQYSTKYFKHSEKDEDSIYPDIHIKYYLDDFINGIDPVMKEITKK